MKASRSITFAAILCAQAAASAQAAALPPANPENNAYFGNLHIHTSWSFDGFTNGSKTTPTDAYAWAQGRTITGSGGPDMQIRTPLDFYMVADHAEYMGIFNQMTNPDSPLSKIPLAKFVTSPDPGIRIQTFAKVLREMSAGKRDPDLSDPKLAHSVWEQIIKAADANYVPGKFTTFAGFEWTSNPQARNLHRVVVFRDTEHLPDLVLSALDSSDPEVLWKWMDDQRARGATLLAIPHNGNASDGRMFEMSKFDGKPLDAAYNKARAANEPLYEISQIKGTSETYPSLSPNDEFAGFEQWDYTLSADSERPSHRRGSFLRPALLDGMSEAVKGLGNPFKYGLIGDSDSHNAAGSNEEFNYTGKFAFENNAKERLTGLPGQPPAQILQIREFSSGGLAGVWAPQNTREAIYDAMQRKETFATSGPMLKVRFFGSFDYAVDDVNKADFVKRAYARGVPMGGDLKPGSGKAPTFLVSALKDPKSGNLDRIQIVKGWIDESGKQQEKIYDVSWSGERKIGADGKLPAVGSSVDLSTATYTDKIGAAALATGWTDPDFNADQHAFYYARVLEIPTPRWNTYDAVRQKMAPLGDVPATLQERAWSSPIWYSPEG
jgi:opacity protein-like surface antigen